MSRSSPLRRYLALIALAALGACGGGGGGSSVPAPEPTTQAPTLALLAGVPPGGEGNVDGPADVARFSRLSGITADAAGSIYVSDSGGFTIRRIAADGMVSTVAGVSNQPGFADGPGNTAKFGRDFLGNIGKVITDASGNLYVADSGNNRIRRISTTGVVTTVAGGAEPGSSDGRGDAARFLNPYGLALDAQGNLYVADAGNSTIRRVAPDGTVTTLAGVPGQPGSVDGTGAQARVATGSLAIDPLGNVLFTEPLNYVIRKMAPGGMVTTIAGKTGVAGHDDGRSPDATFVNPTGIAVDRLGVIYVSDSGMLRRITPDGVVTTLAGAPGVRGSVDGPAASARLGDFDPWIDSAGNVLIADDTAVRKYTASGMVTTIAGAGRDAQAGYADGSGAAARFSGAGDVGVDRAGNVFVLDVFNQKVRKISPAGLVTTFASIDRGFVLFGGIAVDASGNVFVTSTSFCPPHPGCVQVAQIDRFDPAGGHSIVPYASSARLGPIVAAPGGILYFIEQDDRIRRLSVVDGILTTVAETLRMTAMAIDESGSLYITQSRPNHQSTVRKVDPAGTLTTIVDVWGTTSGNAARLEAPRGIAVDTQGNLYVSDVVMQVIRKIAPNGSITTIAGTEGTKGYVGGALPGVLNSPAGMAIYGRDLYIAMGTAVAVVRNTP